MQLRKVKIVATLGPASDSEERLRELFEAGVDVVRLNFSHGTHEGHRQRFERVRKVAAAVGRPVAILGDLSGPKIRVGQFPEGSIELVPGQEVRLVFGTDPGGPDLVPHNYEPLPRDVQVGQTIFLDDGRLRLEATAIAGEEVRARVRVGGTLRDRKGMNLPETALSTPALTEKDRRDLPFARELGVDYLALSFVRHARDIIEAKKLAGDIPVISKIERPEAIENLEEILDASDGAMVARGDLGVEVGHERVPAIQKRIIRESVRRSRLVITATQMLESMIRSPQPTRAEVSDVANAVLDGTDAVMLSGETAVGDYPVETVRLMSSVIAATECSSDHAQIVNTLPPTRTRNFSSAVAAAAVAIVSNLDLAAIAVYTESGGSAIDVSTLRPATNVIAFSRYERVLRRLALQWGILPLDGAWVQGVQGVVSQAETALLQRGLVEPGDSIAVSFCKKLSPDETFQTNILKLHKVRAASEVLACVAEV